MWILTTYKAYYREHCQVKTQPYPGIPEALEELSKDFVLGIVSNKPDAMVQLLCAQHFPGLYAKGETGDCPKKPAPDGVFAVLQPMGVAAENCLYVGDSGSDMQTAKNAGAVAVGVLWGFRDEEELRRDGADAIIADPAQLLELIDTNR